MSISLTQLVSIFRFYSLTSFLLNIPNISRLFSFHANLFATSIKFKLSYFLYGCAATSNGLNADFCCCSKIRLHSFQCGKRSFADCISHRHY